MALSKNNRIKNFINFQENRIIKYKNEVFINNNTNILFLLEKNYPIMYIYMDSMKENYANSVYHICILIHCQLYLQELNKIDIQNFVNYNFINVIFLNSALTVTNLRIKLRDFINSPTQSKLNAFKLLDIFYFKNVLEMLQEIIVHKTKTKNCMLLPILFNYLKKSIMWVHDYSIAEFWIFITISFTKRNFKLRLICNEIVFNQCKQQKQFKLIYTIWFTFCLKIQYFLQNLGYKPNSVDDYVEFYVFFFFYSFYYNLF